MTERPPSAFDLRGWLRDRNRLHVDDFVNQTMEHINAYAERICEQRVSAAVLAEQTRCARIANDARRKYRDMDAFIADEIYQDIRGATAPAERPRSAP